MGLEWFHRICPLRTLVFHLTKLFKLWFYSCIRIFCLLVFESTNNNTLRSRPIYNDDDYCASCSSLIASSTYSFSHSHLAVSF